MLPNLPLVAFISLSLWQLLTCHSSNAKLLLISLDGFRYDYLDLAAEANLSTPTFDGLRARGVFAEVLNVFTTKTLPDHYSIVTGLYEENHGLIHNHFFDPVYNDTFGDSHSRKGHKWFNGTDPLRLVEPIWITNQKAKHTLFPRRSGIYHWPGSEVSFEHHLPFHYEVFSSSTANIPFDVRAMTVVNWFANEEAPINFGAIYFPEPDGIGHKHGPNSKEVLDKVVELDKDIGMLISLLEEHEMLELMNIIITSDHGMTQLDAQKVIYLSDYLSNNTYVKYGDDILGHILPRPDNEETRNLIYEKLKDVPNLKVYRKEEVPEEYHYRKNRRIMPIIILAEIGWVIKENRENIFLIAGQHGYDNKEREMHPFLVAAGPAFQKNYTSKGVVQQIDLYELMCHILGIEPNPNDGDLHRIEHLLAFEEEETEDEYTLITFLAVLIFTASISGICFVAVCRVYRVNIRHRRIPHRLVNIPIDKFDNSTSRLLEESDEEI